MIREGILPIIAGSAVTMTGAVMRGVDMKRHGMSRKDVAPLVGAGLIGFGLAHVILGAADVKQHGKR